MCYVAKEFHHGKVAVERWKHNLELSAQGSVVSCNLLVFDLNLIYCKRLHTKGAEQELRTT